jgi:hypothetical protein
MYRFISLGCFVSISLAEVVTILQAYIRSPRGSYSPTLSPTHSLNSHLQLYFSEAAKTSVLYFCSIFKV